MHCEKIETLKIISRSNTIMPGLYPMIAVLQLQQQHLLLHVRLESGEAVADWQTLWSEVYVTIA